MSATVVTERKFLVQRANARSDEWKTIATKETQEAAEEQFQTSMKHLHTGRLRILDPDGNLVKEEDIKFIFGAN